MEPRIVEGMPFADYVADPSLNFSSLKWMDDCPATFKSMFVDPEDAEERLPSTDEQAFGRAWHHYVLETKTFSSAFYVTPQITRRGAAWDAVLELAGNRQVLWEHSAEQVFQMARALGQHDIFPAIFKKSKRELSIFWEQEGTPCKARIDIWNPHLSILCDLKSARSASPKFFLREIFDRQYDAQLAWYRTALRAAGVSGQINVVIIAQGKVNGYQIMPYELSEEVLAAGEMENAARLKKYQQCKATDTWPGYPAVVYKVTLPEKKAREILGGNV